MSDRGIPGDSPGGTTTYTIQCECRGSEWCRHVDELHVTPDGRCPRLTRVGEFCLRGLDYCHRCFVSMEYARAEGRRAEERRAEDRLQSQYIQPNYSTSPDVLVPRGIMAGSVRKGQIIVLKGAPCRIVDISTLK